jgi:hypothetical protein
MIQLCKEFFLLLKYSVASWIFLSYGLILMLFVSTASIQIVDDRYYFALGSFPISAMIINSGFGLGFLLVIFLVSTAISFGNMTLNTHLVHIILPRINNNRYLYIGSVYTAVTVLIALGFSGMLVFYLRIDSAPVAAFFAWLSTVLSYSFFVYAVLFFLNFRNSSKQAVLLVVIFLFLIPLLISIAKPFMGSKNIFGLYLTDIFHYLDIFLTPFKSLGQLTSDVVMKKPLVLEPLLKTLPGFIVVVGGSFLWFKKKDIH